MSLDATPIVDEWIVHDKRNPNWERLMALANSIVLVGRSPIVQDTSHDVNVGLRQWIGKEITRVELQPVRQSVLADITHGGGGHAERTDGGGPPRIGNPAQKPISPLVVLAWACRELFRARRSSDRE